MFTEINDKYYLNEQAMTVLMADAVSATSNHKNRTGSKTSLHPHRSHGLREHRGRIQEDLAPPTRRFEHGPQGHVQERP